MQSNRRPSAAILTALFSLALPASLVQAAPLRPLPSDNTDSTLRHMTAAEGLREEQSFRAGPIHIRLSTTAGARDLVERKILDETDSGATLDGIVKFTEESFAEGLEAFVAFWGSSRDIPVTEVEVVLLDMGEDRHSTICEVTQFTRLIRCDVRRWHKISRGGRLYQAALSPIHEFTHVVNYRTDPEETKLHRELTGILVECHRLMTLLGPAWFAAKYLSVAAGPLKSKDDLLATTFVNYQAVRHLAFALYRGLESGVYVAPGKLLETFTLAYLRSTVSGDAGFDAAAREVGLTTRKGNPLTLSQLRRDAFAAQP